MEKSPEDIYRDDIYRGTKWLDSEPDGRDFKAGKVNVFWDLVDFPVPEGRKMREIIASVLTRKGYTGEVSITAYGETAEDNLNLDDSGITFEHRSGKFRRLNKMLLDFGRCAVDNPLPHYVPPNLMVVAKNEETTEFFQLLQDMGGSGFNVFIVVPDVLCDDSELVPLPRVKLVWRWNSLLEGGEPMSQIELQAILDQGKRRERFIIDPDGLRYAD